MREPNFKPDPKVLEQLRLLRADGVLQPPPAAAPSPGVAPNSQPLVDCVSAMVEVKVPIPPNYIARNIDAQAEAFFNAMMAAFLQNKLHAAVGLYAAEMFAQALVLRERKRHGLDKEKDEK